MFYRCARFPTREMFVRFFREVYDRDPSCANPKKVGISCSGYLYNIEVNSDGEFRGWPIKVVYGEDGGLKIEKEACRNLYGEINLTCDEYFLEFEMYTNWKSTRVLHGDTFRTYSTSAHERIYVTRRGGILIPMRNITKHQETIVDFYLVFQFGPYVSERLRRLYADNLLVDYSTVDFSCSGASVFKKDATKQQAVVKKEEKTATSSRNVFSTKDIIDGSAISTLIEVLEGKN